MIQCDNCREKFYSPEEHHSLTGCQRKTIAALRSDRRKTIAGLRADLTRERERADALLAAGNAMAEAVDELLTETLEDMELMSGRRFESLEVAEKRWRALVGEGEE